MALLYDKVISTVSKSPDVRSDAEIEQILPWFRKKSELFKSQKAEIVKDILKNCQFMTCKRDYVIIKQGDKGDCFYIILSGCVSIHIQTNLGEDGILYDQDAQDENNDNDDDNELKNQNKKKELDRNLFGNYVGKIPAGRSFGELALINTDCVRNASIIAEEVTDLIIVNRELYSRSLKAFQEKEFNEKKHFVESYPLFQGWHTRYKKQMAMSLRKEKINFDGIVIKQGAPLDGICFLLSGQTKMLVDPYQHEVQYPDRFPLPDIEELEKVQARESIRREMNMAVPKVEEKKSMYHRPRSPNMVDRKKSHKNVEVCVMGAIEIIGDLEMTFGLSSYAETAQCTQEAEVFILDQKNYERLIEKRNPQALDTMRDALQEKLKLRLSWIQDQELPMFRYFLYKLNERKRNELTRYKEYNRKKDIRETMDFWKSGKIHYGPLIDQHGPGSVFYTIRMRDKSKRGHLKGKGIGATGFGITRGFASGKKQGGAFFSRKPDVRMSTLSINSSNGTVTHFNGNGNMHDQENENEEYESDDPEETEMDTIDGPKPVRKSTVLCDRGNESRSDTRTTSKSRSSRGQTSRSDCSVNEFMNQQVNELTLTRLETKIEEWHSKINTKDEKKVQKSANKHTVKLHRYNAEDHQKPLPGTKIILTRKQKPKPNLLSLHLEAMEAANQPPTPPQSALDSTPFTRDLWLDPDKATEDAVHRRCRQKRPLSSKSEFASTPMVKLSYRPKSARNYTLQEYENLKEELRRKQIAYKSMLTRSYTCFV